MSTESDKLLEKGQRPTISRAIATLLLTLTLLLKHTFLKIRKKEQPETDAPIVF